MIIVKWRDLSVFILFFDKIMENKSDFYDYYGLHTANC